VRSRLCRSCVRSRCKRPRARVWRWLARRRRSPSRTMTAGARSKAASSWSVQDDEGSGTRERSIAVACGRAVLGGSSAGGRRFGEFVAPGGRRSAAGRVLEWPQRAGWSGRSASAGTRRSAIPTCGSRSRTGECANSFRVRSRGKRRRFWPRRLGGARRGDRARGARSRPGKEAQNSNSTGNAAIRS
jgi:hypothetical protein